MARINIEDTIWSDPRFMALVGVVGSPHAALGSLVMAWISAQGFWKKDRGLVPESVFACIPCAQSIISCGLADKTEGGVYMRGSEEQFLWLEQRISASKKGGESNKKRALADREPTGSRPEAIREPEGSPLTLTLSQRKKNNTAQPSVAPGGQNGFEEIYDAYPRKRGKTPGKKIYDREIKSAEDRSLLFKAIRNHNLVMDYEKRANDKILYFDTFMRSWRDWLEIELPKAKSNTYGW